MLFITVFLLIYGSPIPVGSLNRSPTLEFLLKLFALVTGFNGLFELTTRNELLCGFLPHCSAGRCRVETSKVQISAYIILQRTGRSIYHLQFKLKPHNDSDVGSLDIHSAD